MMKGTGKPFCRFNGKGNHVHIPDDQSHDQYRSYNVF